MATFDEAQVILYNFEELIMNWLRTSFDTKVRQTLHNTASNGPVWPYLVNGVHLWSRIWSINDLILTVAKVGDLGTYQIMAGKVLWGKIEQIWPKVA